MYSIAVASKAWHENQIGSVNLKQYTGQRILRQTYGYMECSLNRMKGTKRRVPIISFFKEIKLLFYILYF